MSYQFEDPKQIPDEVRRVAAERLDDALNELRDGIGLDPAEAVHTARKDLKKTRSLLRLVRENLRDERYRAENDRLREAAHVLAGARESDAKAESLSSLIESGRGEMSRECGDDAAAWLQRLRSTPAERVNVGEAAAKAAEIIGPAREGAALWPVAESGWEVVRPGVTKAYRRGRVAYASTLPGSDDEAVHEWRKRVKDLWYHLRLLRQIWPAVMDSMAGEVHALSELLGDHHDLSELAAAIADESPVRDSARTELIDHSRARQELLLDQAGPLGERIYAERPKRFAKRLETYWRVWEG